MTRQESFKRRIRERMAKTGERYAAARRVLIEKSSAEPGWVSEPETSDDAVREATGKGWDEWRQILDAWPGDVKNHSAIVAYVMDEHGVSGWWAQSVTVGYERITGLRLKYQQPDGTFTASKSRTVAVDAATLREMLLDDGAREDLFPGFETELRSKPPSKSVRLRVGPGTVQFALDELTNGRTKITVSHEKLASVDDVETWKSYWSTWLDDVDGAIA